MVESNITRRRVLQGAGAIGAATLGSTVISAQEGDGGGDQGAAIRVVNASPDAPNVDVRLESQDGDTAGAGNQTGGENGTATGNESGGGQQGDGAPSIEGVGFRNASGYNEVEPGSYQLQMVPAEGGLIEGFVEDLFGGGSEGGQTVLFEDQIDVEQGTTYTVVAFGELAQGPIPAEGGQMDDGMTGNESGAGGQNATDGVGTDGNETDGAMAGGTGQNETDAAAGQNETDGAGAGAGAGGDQLVSELGFGESQTIELDAGDYSLEIRETGAGGMSTGAGDEMAGNETGGAAAQNATDGNATGGAATDGGVDQNATDGVGASDATGQTGGSGRGFQVQVLEDDVSDPGDQTARLRIFHAVPDVDTVSISQISDGGAGGAGVNETGGAGNQTDEIGGDEGAGQEGGDGGAGSGAGQEDGDAGAGQQENETVGGGASAQQEEGVRRVSFAPDGNTSYSGFALGYFDPQNAASAGDQGGDGGGAADQGGNGTAPADQGNDSEGIGAGQQGDGGANATGNETGGESQEVVEDAESEEFEFVTVEDAQGGERSDGGTGGLLDLAAPADD